VIANSKAATDAGLGEGAGAELGVAVAVVADANQEVMAPVADLKDTELAERKKWYAEIEALYEEAAYFEPCEVNYFPSFCRCYYRCFVFVLFGRYLERMLSDSVCSCL
jgi:hypothetical protein